MAPDLLSTIRREIDERLRELRPLLAEYEQLLVAANTFAVTGREAATAAGAIQLATAGRVEAAAGRRVGEGSAQLLKAADFQQGVATRPSAKKLEPARAARGAAREAILAALEHGSHTMSELVVVTAMSGPNIDGNLRRLVSEGAVVKTERGGKIAWALPVATV
ncbi:MAG TPA: hypothetical protein VFV03_08955 [Solirubrobacteraceae bacterium]|nr:hypothetical protein [Solirubrobacteraceae bacterium]